MNNYRRLELSSVSKANRTVVGPRMLLLVGFIVIAVAAFMRVGIGSELVEYEYVEITVHRGDTLWSIARTFGDAQTDTRKLVGEICRVNKLDSPVIYPGQRLLVPVRPELILEDPETQLLVRHR